MSLVESATSAAAAASVVTAASTDHIHHRISSKRKLDDYAGPNFIDDEDDDGNDDYNDDNSAAGNDAAFSSDLVSVRMRRDEPNAVHSSSSAASNPGPTEMIESSRVSDAQSASYRAGSSRRGSSRPPSALQFFIRTISSGNNLVIHADARDTVRSLHERIESMTGIPVFEQRLIYGGRQLQWEQSLAECRVQNDASLQLVGRMRSTEHPHAWQIIDDMITAVVRLCRGEPLPTAAKDIKNCITEYFTMTPKEESDTGAATHLRIFLSSSAPAALVMLYASPCKANKDCAETATKHFLSLIRTVLPRSLYNQCAPMVLEFCNLLRRVGTEDPLYVSCRNALGSLLESNCVPSGAGLLSCSDGSHNNSGELIAVQEIFPFIRELVLMLVKNLVRSKDLSLNVTGPSAGDVRDFIAFLGPLRVAVTDRVHNSLGANRRVGKNPLIGEEIEFLRGIFDEMLMRMDDCLRHVEEVLGGIGKGDLDLAYTQWSQYLTILKELNNTSKLYEGAEERLWAILTSRKASLHTLIVKYAKRSDDNEWILKHKDVLNFESRRHLVMLMFPEVKEDYEELHEMLIDRSQLLEESFEYVGNADPDSLHGGLFMEFKNEEATGPGVLREWFYLVCQALFNPQRALFVACPNDCRRFFPNQASKIEPMHLDYFGFAGRIIALALMHKVQVGIVFDRVFFLQLAGASTITLEDIRDADPCLYNSCKQILQMDAEFIDSDGLGLTFVREADELGSMKVVELCPGGKSMVVDSRNREEYVSLLIQHQFVKSISDLVSRFMQGFSDMLCKSESRTLFFKTLELEDLDLMLHGSETAISVEDWKAHTEYNGYKESDPQIIWFWKIVEEMPAEQRKALLFFWTSMKYLPVEGFRGLPSRLFIYKSTEPHDRLPSSHTCFYRLCFPSYPSMAVLQNRLRIITQDHFGSSFGTW